MNETQVFDLLTRWWYLRRTGKVPPLWSDFYVERKCLGLTRDVWVFWTLSLGVTGEKVYMTVDELREMVEKGEHDARKPVGSAGVGLGEVSTLRGDSRVG